MLRISPKTLTFFVNLEVDTVESIPVQKQGRLKFRCF